MESTLIRVIHVHFWRTYIIQKIHFQGLEDDLIKDCLKDPHLAESLFVAYVP